ncbi:bifunctional [glutamate--ammonia ligase]-adenylyl-L-tyrosine phosphorylase/[glutamate--ammonia-ligase] adenylyltransferase [Roseomonas sp. NAR14]|uniref:Bifunctional glutamine synthetase adenylyltransferase/adenylyl-removing enzyme n=1 Tax=Roseomonas acroporae TaxID=2937791 RepID=A0A9X1YBP3_9PROT|nr:bifunctional [glutamate--ammonia ligase]-adenylyl-L-tyrosine phosphorylase/[glutamate--ammonia-ligase] adenylyltransferase [Roseomonas acroporae]MCK8787161.1 bifunctional [glutamate--ammonia ligase]-adenylyl-L-tyrosine phosphorylase/[glutamate--ammonia-ligase] adenylyltransferase [Roseomonas acroporae]
MQGPTTKPAGDASPGAAQGSSRRDSQGRSQGAFPEGAKPAPAPGRDAAGAEGAEPAAGAPASPAAFSPVVFSPGRLPRPYDPEAAARLIERFGERGADERAFAQSAEGVALLGAIGGHSPYLSDLAVRESDSLKCLVRHGPDETFGRTLNPLTRADTMAGRAGVAALLRQVKRQAALVAGVADIAGLWTLDQVTGALSAVADAAIDYACAHLLREAAARGTLRLADRARLQSTRYDPRATCRGSGLIVLGLGKLGGRELNYSSDVDLMVLYDPDAPAYQNADKDGIGGGFVRLARDLVRLLDERTADGYVFRTDLRLRPDPSATPLAVSVPGAISYYESMGQNWERAAMLKARPVAGDRAQGEQFLREIRPFIWRRHLDFAAIADIHSIKRQIHAHHADRKGAGERIAIAGHNVKLGRGGIREIEFTAQVLQLIWGGRDPGLRDPTTLGALAALAAAGRIDRRAAADLADAYVFLRTVEHRIQMENDRQTHRIPEDPAGLARLASFLGFPDVEAFSAVLGGHMRKVERHYARLFESAPELSAAPGEPAGGNAARGDAAGDAKGEGGTGSGAMGNLVFTGVDDDPDTLETLRGLGFHNPAGVAALVRGWHHGRTRATRSERARELLTALMPSLLAAFGRQVQPDAALARFDRVLAGQPAGVQILSLLHRNPVLLDRVAAMLGTAPALADHLARNAAAFDRFLSGHLAAEADTAGSAAPLAALVKDARHLEEALEGARRLVTERNFEIDIAALEGRLDADAAGTLRADLADAAIAALLPRVAEEFAVRHGKVAGGAMAVLALGKLGGREMLPGSDLDLVLVYDHAGTESRGGSRALPASTYFSRLAQQFIAVVTAPGPEGRMYAVDMRLRPSGSQGPVATSLASFQRYHTESAWTWERMALTRGRVVAGPPALRRRLAASLRAALTRRPPAGADPDAVLADAAAMRARLLRDLPPDGPWDIKLMPGGLVEVEFVAQALQLRETARRAEGRPEVLATTTRLALAKLARAKALPAAEAELLIGADRLWRTVLGLLRLTVGRRPEEVLPEPVSQVLLEACRPLLPDPPADAGALRLRLDAVAASVRAVFERRVGSLTAPTGGLAGGPAVEVPDAEPDRD